MGDVIGDVVNLSLTDALLQLRGEMPSARRAALRLSDERAAAHLAVEVIGSVYEMPPGEWLTAVRFLGVSPDAHAALTTFLDASSAT